MEGTLVGGPRSLVDPTATAEDGYPNRIVNHVPFPDVDGDGKDDLLEIDVDLREAHPQYGFVGTLRLVTLSGRSGRPIARYESGFDRGVPRVFFARVGRTREPGVIYYVDRFISSAEHPTRTLDVTAVTARGREVWTRHWTSTWTSTPTRYGAATGFAAPVDLLEHRGKGPTDVLVAVYDYAGGVVSVTPTVVSGADGSLLEQERVTVPWVSSTPTPVGAPDLDGDERDDVLVIDTNGLGQGLRANSSVSGDELWHNAEAASGVGFVTADVGDVTGDDTRDLVLGGPVRLIDGATGEPRWERDGGSHVVAPGDVDGDGEVDVLAADVHASEKRFGATMSVITSRGRVLGKRNRYTAARPKPGFSWVLLEEAGDTNRDGLTDMHLNLLHYGEDVTVERRFVVDPTTGAALHEGSNLFALNGALDGRGADLLTVSRDRTGFDVTAVDGHTGSGIWKAHVRERRGRFVAFQPRAAGGKNDGQNVVVTFLDRRSARAVLLDGRNGRRLWTRVLDPSGS